MMKMKVVKFKESVHSESTEHGNGVFSLISVFFSSIYFEVCRHYLIYRTFIWCIVYFVICHQNVAHAQTVEYTANAEDKKFELLMKIASI